MARLLAPLGLLLLVPLPILVAAASGEGLRPAWTSGDLGGVVLSVSWSPDGVLLAAGGNFSGVVLFARGPGGLEPLGRYTSFYLARGLAWSSDGVVLYFGAAGVTLAALDVRGDRLVYVESGPSGIAAAVLPGYLLVGGDGFIAVYALKNKVPVKIRVYGVSDIASCLGRGASRFAVVDAAASPERGVFYAGGYYVDPSTGRRRALLVVIDPVTLGIKCMDDLGLGLPGETMVSSLAVIPGVGVVAGGFSTGLAVLLPSKTRGGPPSTSYSRVQAVPLGSMLSSLDWSPLLGLVAASESPPGLYASEPGAGSGAVLLARLPGSTALAQGVSADPVTGDVAVAVGDRVVLYTLAGPETTTTTVYVNNTFTATVTVTRWVTVTVTRVVNRTLERTVTLERPVTVTAWETVTRLKQVNATVTRLETIVSTTTLWVNKTVTLVNTTRTTLTVTVGASAGIAAVLAAALVAAVALASAVIVSRST